MMDSRVCPARWLPLLCTVTLFAFGPAHAQVPVTGYVVINPIDVCGSTGPTSGTGCAPFNSAKTSPSQATSTTPIGFVDSSTNINLTRAIWLQAGIDVTFFPIVEFDNAGYQSIGDVTTTNNPLYSCLFWNLSTNGNTSILQPPAGVTCPTSLPALKDSKCTTKHCTLPLASSKSNALNMFFVNTINNGLLFGFGWLNNNGVAIGANVFSSSPPRFDTMGHELGHNLALDHCIYGAGATGSTLSSLCPATSPAVACAGSLGSTLPTPGGCNVMDAGTIRNVAASSGCTTASLSDTTGAQTGGQLYNLDTANYLSTPACPQPAAAYPPVSDFLIRSTQASQAQLSGFINPTSNVNATAGGGSTSTAAPLALSTSSSPNKSITITIPNQGGGRPGEFVSNIVFAFANGISPAGKNALQSSSGQPVVIAAFNVNGNNGQNPNCAKQAGLAPPGVHCYEVQYQAGTFIPGTTSTLILNLTQNNQPLTDPQAIVGSQFTPLLETDQPLGMPIAFFATTGNFENTVNGVQASTQFPDPTTAAVVLNASGGPADTSTFTGTPNPITGVPAGCTPDEAGNCPPPVGGVGGDNSQD